jgi:hypothetical protein
MDDKDKSVIAKLVDTGSSAVGGAVKAAVMPSTDTEKAEAVAEKTNEQMLLGDAAVTPEAIPDRSEEGLQEIQARPSPKKSAKTVARPAKASAKKSNKTASKKSAKKSPKKSKVAKKTTKKTKRTKKSKKRSKR